MSKSHRSKLTPEEIVEAFCDNFDEIKELRKSFEIQEDYYITLREDVEDAMSRVFGITTAEREAIEDLLMGWIDHHEKETLRALKRYDFICALMEEKINPKKKVTGHVSSSDIEKARQFPVDTLLEFDKRGKALCLWHNDNDPSLHRYDNQVHCFVCDKHADSIDIYIQLNPGASFVEAVKRLSR